jgi:hypothetical protein
VGFVALGLFFEVCGEGPTWEEAFKASRATPGTERERRMQT